ncbi:MAG: hypothetical protein BGP09_19655 [Rhizobium sp. 60-20]|nr:MAG: hypothetical protein BGP09_19655 [Rhizobium sp. 60-20]
MPLEAISSECPAFPGVCQWLPAFGHLFASLAVLKEVDCRLRLSPAGAAQACQNILSPVAIF